MSLQERFRELVKKTREEFEKYVGEERQKIEGTKRMIQRLGGYLSKGPSQQPNGKKMDWRERAQELAKDRAARSARHEEILKRMKEATQTIIARFGPFFEEVARMLGGYISKDREHEWSLHIPGSYDSVKISFPLGSIYIASSREHDIGYGGSCPDENGSVEIYNNLDDLAKPFDARSFLAEEEILKDQLGEIIVRCAKTIKI